MAWAFLRVDFIEELNYPVSALMHVVGAIAPLIPFFFISELVGDSPRVGGDYLTFTVVGLGATTMMTVGVMGYGGRLQDALQRGTLETFLIEPVRWTTLPVAMNQWHALLGLFMSLLVFGFGVLLGANLETSELGLVMVIAILGVISAATIGIISAAVLLLTLKSAVVIRIYTLASSILAGSLFSIDQLPGWLKPLSYLLPHTYVINGMRSALMSDPGTFNLRPTTAILALLTFNIIVLPMALFLFGRTLSLSRRIGGLGAY